MVLGAAFLGIKAIEYTQEYHEHLIPGLNFQVPEDDRSNWSSKKGLIRERWRCFSCFTSS